MFTLAVFILAIPSLTDALHTPAPTMLVIIAVAARQRNIALVVVALAGLALMVWTPITLMPKHHETSASLWRQLAGGSYVWWAIALIALSATVSARSAARSVSPQLLPASAPAA